MLASCTITYFLVAWTIKSLQDSIRFMPDISTPKLKIWPFLLADLMLLAAAAFIVRTIGQGSGIGWVFALVTAVGLAAWVGVTPFLVQHRADMKFAESQGLITAVEQFTNLRTFTNQISFATAQWQLVQDEAAKTVGAAKQIAERMASEAKAFSDFMQKAGDAEKGHLRLEVEKLRRAEGDWLQVLVLTLDHVYALLLAGRRSGQQNIIQQLTTFQHACRDVARKVGLIAFEAQSNEAFNAQIHQVLEGTPAPKAAAQIADTLAPGYTYQGQLIRNALVSIQAEKTVKPEEDLLLA